MGKIKLTTLQILMEYNKTYLYVKLLSQIKGIACIWGRYAIRESSLLILSLESLSSK